MSEVIYVVLILFLICCIIKVLSRNGQLLRDDQHHRRIIDMLSEELTTTSNQCDKLMQDNKTLHAVLDYHEKEVKRLKEALENYEHYKL